MSNGGTAVAAAFRTKMEHGGERFVFETRSRDTPDAAAGRTRGNSNFLRTNTKCSARTTCIIYGTEAHSWRGSFRTGKLYTVIRLPFAMVYITSVTRTRVV